MLKKFKAGMGLIVLLLTTGLLANDFDKELVSHKLYSFDCVESLKFYQLPCSTADTDCRGNKDMVLIVVDKHHELRQCLEDLHSHLYFLTFKRLYKAHRWLIAEID